MALPIPAHAYRTHTIGYCDCCDKHRELTQSFVYGGTEAWACWECRGEPDPAEEQDEDDFRQYEDRYLGGPLEDA